MPKKEKIEEVTPKVVQSIVDQVIKLEDNFNSFKDLPKKMLNISEQINKLDNRINLLKDTPKTMQSVSEQINKLEERINSSLIPPKEFQNLLDQVNKLDYEVKNLKNDHNSNQRRMEQTISTQEEIIMDMIKKFNDEFIQHRTNILQDFKSLKTQQDVLKISYAVNEKKLLEKLKTVINDEIKNRIDGKESEILMKIWIEEFKDIIDNFEKLKKLKPKEFSVRLNEIANTIELFKQKIQGYG